MNLSKQIHVYSLDTACFYDEDELRIHAKLLRLYSLRNRIKDKLERQLTKMHDDKKIRLYERHQAKANRWIKYFKECLYDEFQNTRKRNQESGALRKLREECLVDRNVVSVFDSFLTRTLGCAVDRLTMDIMIIQVYFFQVAEDLIKDGCEFDGERYVLFSASAGQIRTKKFVMIKESLLNRHSKTLMCGLTIGRINERGGINANKFLAYYALASSATEEWTDFDIDKSIVVEDFETLVTAEVDYINDEDYTIARKTMDVPIPHMDGCGIMLDGQTKMVRLPWVKGLMVPFDYQRFILAHQGEGVDGLGIVRDIYGQEYDILNEDIRYIFTKSQFKMWKYYDSWEEYKSYYKKHGCMAGKANEEEEYISNAQINYQMLQSLSDMTKREMERVTKSSMSDIVNIGSDFRTTMRLLGATEYNTHPNYMQRSLMVYPELMQDEYNKQILKDVKKSLVKQSRAGKLSVYGKYTFLAPDLYAFCEWLFLGHENPKGILRDGEVACNLYPHGIEVDCLRSPHLYKEHAIRTNRQDEIVKEWFDTKCVYTSCHDLISKMLQFDVDGDKSLVVADKTIVKVAKRNMEGIVPLYYNMRKAMPTQLNNMTLFQGLEAAYTGGNIGTYSNNISKIWNEGKITQQEMDCIKLLCMENNFVIDYAKTLYKPTRPEPVNQTIKEYTNKDLPWFFQYAKDKTILQTEKWIPTPVNHLENLIKDSRLQFNKDLGALDVKVLLSDLEFELTSHHSAIIDLYDYYNSHKWSLYNHADNSHRNSQDLYVYHEIRRKLLELPYRNSVIVDALVFYLFTKRKSSAKKTLWACFGREIYGNICKNLSNHGHICPICGKRIHKANQVYCSDECQKIMRQDYFCRLRKKMSIAQNATPFFP